MVRSPISRSDKFRLVPSSTKIVSAACISSSLTWLRYVRALHNHTSAACRYLCPVYDCQARHSSVNRTNESHLRASSTLSRLLSSSNPHPSLPHDLRSRLKVFLYAIAR
ncbi:hypothetical protein IE53DRAFT_4908 [Violaceomyces palustris]|uniref:Uncharacterized protein n=1 Tax=Violaceomyces palustris TaxID=1673888 RepID=A0ACD0P2M8_9BASI|nr:hypothetical protein IE53DRAFT_4908 [Violaceomyces palustris]